MFARQERFSTACCCLLLYFYVIFSDGESSVNISVGLPFYLRPSMPWISLSLEANVAVLRTSTVSSEGQLNELINAPAPMANQQETILLCSYTLLLLVLLQISVILLTPSNRTVHERSFPSHLPAKKIGEDNTIRPRIVAQGEETSSIACP